MSRQMVSFVFLNGSYEFLKETIAVDRLLLFGLRFEGILRFVLFELLT